MSGQAMLRCPAEPSATGAYQLSWSSVGKVTVFENGQLLYRGAEQGTSISGRPAGTYAYRLQDSSSQVELGSCNVTVAPPTTLKTVSFFCGGFALCLALVIAVVAGHRAHRRGAIG